MAAQLTVDELDAHLRALLDPTGVADYGPNGLQVDAGHAEVRRIATAVTANLACIEAAAAWGADALIAHHGIYWGGAPTTVTGALGGRVRALIAARMALFGYHLPLDGHAELGNAATLARTLGLVDPTPAFVHRGMAVGCVARFPSPLTVAEARALLAERVSDRLHFFAGGPPAIARVGIVTGGAARDVREAIDVGCDLYVTGEAGEYSQATAFEEGIHFAACGHHRTERFGPMALADHLAAAFPGVEVRFVDVDNPV